ncbi:MAG: hypothetical protein IPN74_07235 [Haliscomenobacter sp.]|nr:hypothetical protein [Haliscomenobacter sp.]
MKMILMGLAAVWVLSSALCCPPENQDLAKAMLLFDQGYIPAWYYAKTGDMVKAKKAVFYLEFQWQRLQAAWNSQMAEFPESGLALQRASARLSESYLAMDNNDPVRAKRSLERAQEEMRQLRAACGVSYFLDRWYALEGDLSAVLNTLKDPQLQLMEWEEVTEMALGCSRSWNAVYQLPTDTRLLGWEEAEQAALTKAQNTIAQKMAGLQRAMNAGDQDQAAQAAQAVYDAFWAGLKHFGTFSVASASFAERNTTQPPAKIRAL